MRGSAGFRIRARLMVAKSDAPEKNTKEKEHCQAGKAFEASGHALEGPRGRVLALVRADDDRGPDRRVYLGK